MFNRKKAKVKLCEPTDHDWVQISKCKDALGNHPCKYFPEGCNTCMTRFECYTKDTDTYRDRITGVFYACKKCPAVKIEGEITEWNTEPLRGMMDIRDHSFIGLDNKIEQKLRDAWKEKEAE